MLPPAALAALACPGLLFAFDGVFFDAELFFLVDADFFDADFFDAFVAFLLSAACAAVAFFVALACGEATPDVPFDSREAVGYCARTAEALALAQGGGFKRTSTTLFSSC